MRPTRWTDLLAAIVVAGAIVYLMLRIGYDSLPPLGYLTAAPIAVLAVIEFVIARRVRGVVRRDPNAKPMTAISIARCAALGKASALVGAAAVGAVLGLFGRVLPDASRVSAAASDARVGTAVLVVSIALAAAGIYLERAGIHPGETPRNPSPSR
ncbi:MAG TPA: DUF3180 domain-containing protein [Jatrophihabitans sp.]